MMSLDEVVHEASDRRAAAERLSYHLDLRRFPALHMRQRAHRRWALLSCAGGAFLVFGLMIRLGDWLLAAPVAAILGIGGWITAERWIRQRTEADFKAERHRRVAYVPIELGLTERILGELEALPAQFFTVRPSELKHLPRARVAAHKAVEYWRQLHAALNHERAPEWVRAAHTLLDAGEESTVTVLTCICRVFTTDSAQLIEDDLRRAEANIRALRESARCAEGCVPLGDLSSAALYAEQRLLIESMRAWSEVEGV